MTSLTIANLYSEFRTTYVNGPDYIINFCEKNSILLNNIKQLNDKEELETYIGLIGLYTEALYEKGRYIVAINTVDKYLPFIDEEIQRLKATEIKKVWYNHLSFTKGMASYNLRDYKTSTPIFKKLILLDNQNDRYKNWLNSSKYGQRQWYIRIIMIFSGFLIAFEILFKNNIPVDTRILLDALGLLGLISTWTYDHYVRRSFREKTK